MSQITIVDQALDFTDIDPAGDDSSRSTPDQSDAASRQTLSADELSKEQQRIRRELTSIRISGHLPE